MHSFWKEISGWFNKMDASSPTKPFIHEVLERSDSELEQYNSWKDKLVRKRLSDWNRDQFLRFNNDSLNLDPSFSVLSSSSSNGFVIHFEDTNHTLADAKFYLEYLKEKIVSLQYKIQLADSRTYVRKSSQETTERYYLKPRINLNGESKIDQKFGNITLILKHNGTSPNQLSLQATIYHDHLYKKGNAFEKLVFLITEAA